MAGITANRPMGRIRCKDEVSGLGKPKKRSSKPIPQRDEKGNASLKAHTCLTLQKTNTTQYTWQMNMA